MQRASEKAETVSAEKKNMSFASGHKNNNNNLGCGFNILIYLLFLPQNLVEMLTIWLAHIFQMGGEKSPASD